MPGNNGNSSYFSVYGQENKPIDLTPAAKVTTPTDPVAANDARVASLEAQGYLYDPSNNSWISPGEAYQNARASGLSRRASRVYRDQGKFLYQMQQDDPENIDYDYVFRNLRANGLTRRAARAAMRDPEFWKNIRRQYGPQQAVPQQVQPTQPQSTAQKTITAAPIDAHEEALRDKMDAEALAHEKVGDVYDPATNTWSKPKPEVAQDDLTRIASFREAFKTARERGLTQFRWRSTKANPSGLFGTQLRSEVKKKTSAKPQAKTKEQPQSSGQQRVSTQQVKAEPQVNSPTKSYSRPTFNGEDYYSGVGWQRALGNQYYDWFMNNHPDRAKYSKTLRQQAQTLPGYKEFAQHAGSMYERRGGFSPGYYRKHQQGGKIEKVELQKLFTAFLIQQSGAKTEQELTDFIQTLGEDGVKSMYRKFIQSMQTGTQSVKNGAKLNYIKSLRGKCPEGYELGFFKEGGKVCAKCIAKQEKQGAIQFRPMQGEKGTKMVQDFKKELKNKKDKINISKKKTEKKELGGTIQINQDFLNAFKCGGKVEKDCKGASMKCKGGLVKKSSTKVPIKEKFIDSDKCGGKAKKKKK